MTHDATPKTIYWHRDLPPLDAEAVSEHTIEADSSRVPRRFSRSDDLWDRCYAELMENVERRLLQELQRLGGRYARVHDEKIEPKHNDATGESWLHGRFGYVLYR
ncbi:MAG: hypothetical protein DIU54_013035 [Acidobacteriota bacterium]|jgi:hypothetical protein|nr:MAG: hypothetical protein DIU54_15240 [Acidobacteriota bacterium]